MNRLDAMPFLFEEEKNSFLKRKYIEQRQNKFYMFFEVM